MAPLVPRLMRRSRRNTLLSIAVLGFATAATGVQAQESDADKIVKAMSDFIAGQNNLSASLETDIEVVTRDMQKIQFSSSGTVQLSRPDKLRVTRVGGYIDVEVVYDGKMLSVLSKDPDTFAQLPLAGTVADLVDKLREEHGADLPGADMLSANAREDLMDDVHEVKHIGRGVIDGVECEHIAARGGEVDWQLWVELGPRPFPRKYVISSKHMTGAPQFTLRMRDWSTNPPPAAAFVFTPPPAAKKVEFASLPHLDEVPESAPLGGSR